MANNTRPRFEVNSTAITIPAANLLIAACARYYSAELETADSDFALLAKLDTN